VRSQVLTAASVKLRIFRDVFNNIGLYGVHNQNQNFYSISKTANRKKNVFITLKVTYLTKNYSFCLKHFSI
jgi:hypothetical protein